MRILIIEDQENLAKLLKKGFVSEGFAVDIALDGEAGQKMINLNHRDYDVILLDLMLPKKCGDDICRDTRAKGIATPIIMLTAKGGINDVISGLDIGADDYLPKPFSFEVLLARIRAIMRRPKETNIGTELKAKNIILNPATKKVFREEEEIKLTLKEFSLLEYFMRNPNQVIDREQLISKVWDFSYDSFGNVVDVHITNLRKKLSDRNGKVIETVRGIGYRINA